MSQSQGIWGAATKSPHHFERSCPGSSGHRGRSRCSIRGGQRQRAHLRLDPGASCKYPGNSFPQFDHGYNLVFTVNAPAAGVLCITDIQVPNGTAEVILVAPDDGGNPDCTSIPAGPSTVTFVVGAENSANGTGTFTFSFNGVAGTFTAAFTNFRPCTQADVPT